MDVRVKRIYEAAAPDDGQRILVDRLWPRGISKDAAKLDAWLKEVAPSDELRKWYHRNPERWDGFRERYGRELSEHEDGIEELLGRARRGTVTLLYSSKETEHNNAVALKEYLEREAS